ncbi:putative RNA-directed DNA polymerase [Tanacetum coccineum]
MKYEIWFFEAEGGWGGRGVKEKQHSLANYEVKDMVVVSLPGVDEPVVAVGNTKDVNVGQTPIRSTIYPKLGTSYAKLFTGESIRKSVNFRTLITPARNETDVVVSLESIRGISERFVNTAYGFFLGKRVAYPVVANYFSSMDGFYSMLENGPWFICNNLRILKKWNPDVNLLKEDVVNVSVWVKLHGVPVTAFSEDGLSAIATKLDECPKKIGSDVAKNLKNPSQASRGVSVGPKLGFKPVKQVYTPVSKKNNVNTSSFKTKDAECKKEWILILKYDEGKSLKKVDYPGDHDSEDEVESTDNEMASFLA